MYTLNNNLIGSVYKDGLMSTGYICLSVNNKLLYTLILYVVLTSTCTIWLNYIKITIMITTLNDKSNSYFQKLPGIFPWSIQISDRKTKWYKRISFLDCKCTFKCECYHISYSL